VDLSSTDKPITAPFYKDIQYKPLAPLFKDCCHYGIRTSASPSQYSTIAVAAAALLLVAVLIVVYLVA
jgi:hypothetical protein